MRAQHHAANGEEDDPMMARNPARESHRWRLATMLIIVGLIALSCGDSGDDAGPGSSNGGHDTDATRFVGLEINEATALAESEERSWHISRDDDDLFPMDASLVDRRVTFEVDDGIVTAAEIETDSAPGSTRPEDTVPDDEVLGQLQAEAFLRLLTVDHSFASDSLPFETVIVSLLVADDSGRQLQPLAMELIAAQIEPDAALKFTEDPDAEIADLVQSRTAGVAVTRIDDIRIDGAHAEIDVNLWCGNACGVHLTYEADMEGSQWIITGTSGPIAVA